MVLVGVSPIISLVVEEETMVGIVVILKIADAGFESGEE